MQSPNYSLIRAHGSRPPASREDQAALLSFPLEERTPNEITSYACLMPYLTIYNAALLK